MAVPATVTVPVGLSFTPVMLTIVMPAAASAPPAPWDPVLPSLKLQSMTTVAGGASELLA